MSDLPTITPKNGEQLAKLMLGDQTFLRSLRQMTIQFDEEILRQVTRFFSSFAERNRIDMRLLSTRDVQKAFGEFYRKSKIDGTHVKFTL